MNIDKYGWNIAQSTTGEISPSFSWEENSVKYDDLFIGGSRKLSHHYETVITIGEKISFKIEVTESRGNVNFVLIDGSGLSNDLEGIIGSFQKENGYAVLENENEKSAALEWFKIFIKISC